MAIKPLNRTISEIEQIIESYHAGSTSNPHNVTSSQVGAYSTSEADSNFAASGHIHDGRYYTQSEVRNWVNNNADVPNADYADNAGNANSADTADTANSADPTSLIITYNEIDPSKLVYSNNLNSFHTERTGADELNSTYTETNTVDVSNVRFVDVDYYVDTSSSSAGDEGGTISVTPGGSHSFGDGASAEASGHGYVEVTNQDTLDITFEVSGGPIEIRDAIWDADINGI